MIIIAYALVVIHRRVLSGKTADAGQIVPSRTPFYSIIMKFGVHIYCFLVPHQIFLSEWLLVDVVLQ